MPRAVQRPQSCDDSSKLRRVETGLKDGRLVLGAQAPRRPQKVATCESVDSSEQSVTKADEECPQSYDFGGDPSAPAPRGPSCDRTLALPARGIFACLMNHPLYASCVR